MRIMIFCGMFIGCCLFHADLCKGETETYASGEIEIRYRGFISTTIESFNADKLRNTEGFKEANSNNKSESFFIDVKVSDKNGKELDGSVLTFDSNSKKTNLLVYWSSIDTERLEKFKCLFPLTVTVLNKTVIIK